MKLKKLTALMMLGLGVSVAQAAELPNITILATGGTIAGSGETAGFSAALYKTVKRLSIARVNSPILGAILIIMWTI